jgi:hypothetical protein
MPGFAIGLASDLLSSMRILSPTHSVLLRAATVQGACRIGKIPRFLSSELITS